MNHRIIAIKLRNSGTEVKEDREEDHNSFSITFVRVRKNPVLPESHGNRHEINQGFSTDLLGL